MADHDKEASPTTTEHPGAEEEGPTHHGSGPKGTCGRAGGGAEAIPGRDIADISGQPEGRVPSDTDAEMAGGLRGAPGVERNDSTAGTLPRDEDRSS